MADKLTYIDGKYVKTINPFDLESRPEAWTTLSGRQDEKETSIRLVSTIFAAIDMRAKALASLPFSVYSSRGAIIDDSDNYKNAVGFLPYPAHMFGLTEMALVASGRAYYFNGANKSRITQKIRYWLPDSVTPEFNDNGTVKKFIRKTEAGPKDFREDQVLHFWLPDDRVEAGPPTIWPLSAAATAAGALQYITLFVRDYMQRGAVKAMILALDGNPPQEERERIETWFNTFMRGARNLMWRAFNMQKVTPTIIGEGMDSFKDLKMRSDLKQDILEAFGIPASLFGSDYSSREGNARIADERHFYTNTIIPDARLIQHTLNEQSLKFNEMWLEFEPERLDVFQTDESPKILSLDTLLTAVSAPSVTPEQVEAAIEIVGLTVTPEQMRKLKMRAKPEEPEAVLPKIDNQEPDEDSKAYKAALDKFSRKALKHVGKAVDFVDNAISPDVVDQIKARLATCQTADEVKAVFAGVRREQRSTDYAPLLFGIQQGLEALRMPQKGSEELKINITAEKVELQNEKMLSVLGEMHSELRRDLTASLKAQPVQPINITVEPTPITIQNNVDMSGVKMPDVNVTVPEIKMPEIKPNITVKVPEKSGDLRVTRDRDGKISGIESK